MTENSMTSRPGRSRGRPLQHDCDRTPVADPRGKAQPQADRPGPPRSHRGGQPADQQPRRGARGRGAGRSGCGGLRARTHDRRRSRRRSDVGERQLRHPRAATQRWAEGERRTLRRPRRLRRHPAAGRRGHAARPRKRSGHVRALEHDQRPVRHDPRIPATSTARSEAVPAGTRPTSRQESPRRRSGRISAARSGCLRASAASTASARPQAPCRTSPPSPPSPRLRRRRRWARSGRSREPSTTLSESSASSPCRIRSTR